MAENNYDLDYTGSMVDRILDTGYDLQNQGYIFRGLASHYTGTPTERTWLIAPTGSTGFGLSSPVPPGSIGICMYNGSSWSAEVLNTLTLDSAPTTGSGNGITSGAVKTLAESITNAIGQLEQSVSDRFTSLELEDTTGSLQAEVLSITLKYVFEGEEEALTSLSILAATAEKAGLMSAADKQKLDAFVTNIRSLRIQDTTQQADQGTEITNTMKWTIGGVTEAITAFTLYAATTSKAGLMSAADKTALDTLPSLINAGYLYAGIATPSTVPSSTDAKIYYIAIEGGTYTSFGNLNVTQGINIIYKSGNAWSVAQAVGIDDEPKAGSGNLVKSEGVYDAVGFKFTRHGFLSTFGGYVESEYHKCTELIPCHQATYKIQCNAMSSQMSVAFYDRQKVFLSGLSGSSESVTLTTFTGDVPSDCYYMVVCNVNGHLPSAPRGNVIINRIENYDEGFVVSGDKTAFSIDGYFDAAGNLHEATAWKATDYIPVRPGVPYSAVVYRQTGTSNIVFYNSSKQVLSTVIGSEGAVTAISGTVPDSAYFARFCSYNTAETIREVAFGFYFDFKSALGGGEDNLFGLYKNNFTGKPFSFAGKKAAFFGDSVTYGVKSDPLSRADKCYREWLCERLGLTGTNCAVSGSFICDLEDAETSILNKVLDTISSQSEYDFIFIAGGVNDYWTGKPLGTIEDSTYATFYGALNVMCEHLTQTIGSDTEVIFLTPINCTRSDLSQTTNPLDDYRNAIFRVATIHGFNVVDTSVIGFPSNIKDTYFRSQLIADGVHPTELGHKIMGLNIAAILQQGPATKEVDNEFIVDINGNGHYTNPFEAMVGLKGKDTANHPITIKVMPGTYIMPTLPPEDFFTYCTNRYLSLIGVDKVNCILRNDNGYYNASSYDPDNLGDNSPLKISGNIYIANLTIISTDNDNAEETGDMYHRSYCIHMDATASAGSIMEVHNCRLVNNHAPCIGFGIPKDVTLKITDCELEADFWNPNFMGAVIYGHDRDGSVSEVEEHVVVANCIIKSQNGDAFKSYNNHSALMDCVFVNNACALPSGKGVVLDTYTSVIPPSFGNSVEAMNVITN